nr:marinostatin D=proteinase inhibitor [Alteromonas sp., B-10-31, Peptide, 11 aa] [Alteromonas]
ATMRYPSDDSE